MGTVAIEKDVFGTTADGIQVDEDLAEFVTPNSLGDGHLTIVSVVFTVTANILA